MAALDDRPRPGREPTITREAKAQAEEANLSAVEAVRLYKELSDVERCFANLAFPTASSMPPCSELSRCGPGKVRARGKLVATANLDSSYARRLLHYCGSGRRNGLPGSTRPSRSPRGRQAAVR
jgi:hypothetical protein